MLLWCAGMNEALLKKQMADRHARMMARTRQRNRIRAAKFKVKLMLMSRMFSRK